MSVHSIDAVMLPSLEPVALSSINISADEGEYGWSLSASGKAPLFDQLAPVSGLPARIRITVDGTSWVFAINPPARTRRFGDYAVQITGRSVTSLLGAPHMPVQSWANANARTAQQLVLDALEFTGVGLDWGIPDWLVPAGAWSHQAAPLGVASRVAEAVGAILQSHRTDEKLQFLPRYPLMPWEWAAATPDVQMPLASVESDALQPIVNPAYNGVYVVGVNHGPRAHVLRDGTLGELLAPMVTDQLITHPDAARQRGRAVLGAAGTMVRQPLELPVLTGFGLPGFLQMNQLVEVVEPSVTWRGLVRSISITGNAPTVRQNIVLERHL